MTPPGLESCCSENEPSKIIQGSDTAPTYLVSSAARAIPKIEDKEPEDILRGNSVYI